MSLRSRLALLQATALAVSLALLGALLVEALERALIADVDDVLSARAGNVVADVSAATSGELTASEVSRLQLDPDPFQEFAAPGVYVQVLATDGRVLRGSRNLPIGGLPFDRDALAAARGGRQSIDSVPVGGGERVRLLAVPVYRDDSLVAVVHVGQSLHQVDTVLRGLVRLLIVGGVVSLLGAIAATWLIVRRALLPLERIAATAERIANTRNVNLQVPGSSTREIGQLATSFNRMIERLRRLIESQQQLLADTSHELRNPLTVIRTNLGLLSRELDPATRAEVATETEEEARRMSRLVDDLLLLAHQEAAGRAELLPVRLDQLLLDAVDRFRQLAPDRTIDSESDDVAVRGDPERLRQLVSNLLDNAVCYTPPGGAIRIDARRTGSRAELVVQDSGVGIAPEHLPRIFDRFYRVDPARGRATGGSGLGLAIVKHIAAAHGGDVRVQSEPGRGARFTVTLPAEPSWSQEATPAATPAPPSARAAGSPPAEAPATGGRPAPRQ